jgi:hypothetical protein
LKCVINWKDIFLTVRASCKRWLPYAQKKRKGTPLFLNSNSHREDSEQSGLAMFSQLLTLRSNHLCSTMDLHTCPGIKSDLIIHKFNHFFRSSFPYEGSCITGNLWNNSCAFLLVVCLLLQGWHQEPRMEKHNRMLRLERWREV